MMYTQKRIGGSSSPSLTSVSKKIFVELDEDEESQSSCSYSYQVEICKDIGRQHVQLPGGVIDSNLELMTEFENNDVESQRNHHASARDYLNLGSVSWNSEYFEQAAGLESSRQSFKISGENSCKKVHDEDGIVSSAASSRNDSECCFQAQSEILRSYDVKPLQPREQMQAPKVPRKAIKMKQPKRKHTKRPSLFFIQSPFRESRRVTEYAVVFRKRRLALGYSILLICICLFLYEFSIANWTFAPPKLNPAIGPPSSALLRAGAKNTALILEGEWWRLIAPSFLHAGIIHLLFNMGGLLNLLYEMEPVHGWKPLLFIYVFAGVFSTGCSALFLPTQIMVGSSGAIFGLMGAQLSDVIHNWGVFYQPARKLMFLCTMTAINLMLGLMPFLDNFAHVSGTLMGILCGLILLNQKKVDRLGFHRPKRCYQIMASSFSVAMAIIFFVTIFALLFGRSNPYNFCPACLKMACVTFPPKAQNPWWDCSTCARVGFSVIEYVNGTFILECPFESNQIIGFSVPGSDQAQSFFLEYCKSKC